MHGHQLNIAGAGVVHELIDDRVQLVDVCGDVSFRLLINHAHLRFQAQTCQWCTQVVRNACEHHGAIFIHFRQLACHAVEALVHFANLAGDHGFIQHRVILALANATGSERQLFQRLVDQTRNRGRTQDGRHKSDAHPDEPGATRHRFDATRIGLQPIIVALDLESHPKARDAIDVARHQRRGPQSRSQLFPNGARESADFKSFVFVARLMGFERDRLLVGDRLDQRDSVDAV